MLVLFALALAGMLYLADRISRFHILKKWTGGKKRKGILAGLVIMAVITAVLWAGWGSMNAVICILHLLVFWMVSELIFTLVKRVQKKTFSRYYAGAVAIIFTIGYLSVGWY